MENNKNPRGVQHHVHQAITEIVSKERIKIDKSIDSKFHDIVFKNEKQFKQMDVLNDEKIKDFLNQNKGFLRDFLIDLLKRANPKKRFSRWILNALIKILENIKIPQDA